MGKQQTDRKRGAASDGGPVRVDAWFERKWVPPAFFLLFTVIYFAGFVFSGDVMVGLDTRQEFYLGKQPAAEKLADLAPEDWDRYLGGTPVSGFRKPKYFPLYPVYLFTTFHRYLGWRYFFATFFAGLFTYLCARGLKLGHATAAVAGVAYASSPTLLTFIYPGQEGKMLVMGLLPLMVWALNRIVDTRKPFYTFVLGAGVAAGIYTPHLQMLYYALIGLGLLFVVRLVQTWRAERNVHLAAARSGLAAAGIVLGLAVGAVGTFPAYHYTTTESRRAGEEGEGVSIEYAQSWSLHPEEIASLLVPEFVHFFRPEERENLYWGRNSLKLNAEYFGIAALFLAGLALVRIRDDDRILPLALLGLIALLFSLGPHTPVFAFFYHFVPGMNVLRTPGMIAFLFAFPAVLLAAIALDRLVRRPEDEDPGRAVVWGGVLGVLFALAALAPDTLLSAWNALFWSDIPNEKLSVARRNLPYLATGAGLGLLWVAALTGLVVLRIQKRIPAQAFLLGLLPVILIDTWRIDKQFLQYVDPDRYPDPEAFIPQTLNAIQSDHTFHRTWVPTADVQLPEDTDLLMVDYHEPFIVRRYDRVTQELIRTLQTGRHEAALQLLNVLNVKYIAISAQKVQAILGALAKPAVSQENVELKSGIDVVANERSVYCFRNANANPFFYLADRTVRATDEDAALARLTDPSFDPGHEVVLESGPDRSAPRERSPSEGVTVDTFDAREGLIRLSVETDHPRILVVSQNYHPHWRATVDGRPAEIHRANFVWQGVAIPAGQHLVELSYHDPLAQFCRWLSLVATIVLIAGLVKYGRADGGQTRAA